MPEGSLPSEGQHVTLRPGNESKSSKSSLEFITVIPAHLKSIWLSGMPQAKTNECHLSQKRMHAAPTCERSPMDALVRVGVRSSSILMWRKVAKAVDTYSRTVTTEWMEECPANNIIHTSGSLSPLPLSRTQDDVTGNKMLQSKQSKQPPSCLSLGLNQLASLNCSSVQCSQEVMVLPVWEVADTQQ